MGQLNIIIFVVLSAETKTVGRFFSYYFLEGFASIGNQGYELLSPFYHDIMYYGYLYF